MKVVNSLLNDSRNGRIDKNDRCCGEAGTLAITRPDVSTQVRFRKEEEVRAGAREATRGGCGPGQDSDLLPLLPPGPEALQR